MPPQIPISVSRIQWHRILQPGFFSRAGSTVAGIHRIEYKWIKGVEKLENYQPGGYHPIMVGDLLHDRYHIADKLGYGGYSTVWLALDTHLKRYVALKVNATDSLSSETAVLKALSASLPPSAAVHPGRGLVPVLLDEFEVQGPNGNHTCYTVTPARCNLREISFSRLFPLDVARALAYGLTLAVAYTHSQGYVHGGSSTPAKAFIPLFLGKYAEHFSISDAQPLLTDLGEAFAPASEVRLGQDCHTPPAFRAPEAKFEPQSPLGYPSDIWSLSTAIWEIVGMKAIFSTDIVPEDEITAQQIDVLEPMPADWWRRWKGRSSFFEADGCPTESYKGNRWPALQESFEVGVQKWRRKVGDEIGEDEKTALLDLMRRMLAFRPEERLTVDEVLESEWMVRWALPEYKRNQQCAT
ncbi:kinase-like protein [Aspergillus fijiensis CBS 313.89]|uniref:non-specific serine/threonine protein kinase n=1 Tax=Aspergillus fijiensis CBS 313.89 TaxID=1448319 RepID=A0A8G1RXG8_9EURO|nr:kinase-like protein [Aspergillus fijiensis CBS 313.89]RAK80833.1 kinase-like protein [Aspergillus fijiensis CBS 313.89]